MPEVRPLTPEALRVLISALLVTTSPKRLRRMRRAVELSLGASEVGLEPVMDAQSRAAHELVLIALERAEQKATRRRR